MNKTALTLVIVGALNWLLIGIFQFDLVAAIFGGQTTAFSRIIYCIIGIAGIWAFSFWKRVDRDVHERDVRKDSYQRSEALKYEFGKDYSTNNDSLKDSDSSKVDNSQNNDSSGNKDS